MLGHEQKNLGVVDSEKIDLDLNLCNWRPNLI